MADRIKAYTAPIDTASVSGHPAFDFYTKYATRLRGGFHQIDPEEFYHPECAIILPDRSIITGAKALWKLMGEMYRPFAKVEREVLTLTAMTDEMTDTHRIHYDGITTLYPTSDGPGVPVAQAFVYVLGKAAEGGGTDGLQVIELRNYYDRSLIDNALTQLKK